MNQVALVEVLPPAQPGAAHAAAIEDMGEGALDQLAAPAHGLAPDIRSQPHAIGVDRFARRLVAMPTQGSPSDSRHAPTTIRMQPSSTSSTGCYEAGRIRGVLERPKP